MSKPGTPSTPGLPLEGRTIVVTRAKHQSAGLAGLLEAAGARVIEAPVIDLVDPLTWTPADEAISNLSRYDLAIFTSANAAERFCRRMEHLGCPMPGARPRIVAIGQATARCLADRGFTAADVAGASRADGVLELLASTDVRSLRILIPRAEVAADTLPEGLRARGATVDVVAVYRTIGVPIDAEVRRLLSEKQVDLVTFTSGSTVKHLMAGIGGPGNMGGARVAVIGPVTARAARDAGLTPDIVAEETGMESLAGAIASSYTSR